MIDFDKQVIYRMIDGVPIVYAKIYDEKITPVIREFMRAHPDAELAYCTDDLYNRIIHTPEMIERPALSFYISTGRSNRTLVLASGLRDMAENLQEELLKEGLMYRMECLSGGHISNPEFYFTSHMSGSCVIESTQLLSYIRPMHSKYGNHVRYKAGTLMCDLLNLNSADAGRHNLKVVRLPNGNLKFKSNFIEECDVEFIVDWEKDGDTISRRLLGFLE